MAPIRIAIVDDHAIVRDGLSQLLSCVTDFEVVGTCGDAAGALRLVEERAPDVLLLDLALPAANGLDLIAPFAASNPAVRVLVLSMHGEPAYATAALERGAWGLVSKEAAPETLAGAIRRVSAGERIPVGVRLLPREEEVLRHLAMGESNEDIALALGIQRKTVEGYAQRLMDKLGVHTRAGLVAYGRRVSVET